MRSIASPISRGSRGEAGSETHGDREHREHSRGAAGEPPIYRFGGGVSDGEAGNKELARRQGREPCRNGLDRPAGAARLHDLDPGLRALLRKGDAFRATLEAEVASGIAHIETIVGKSFGDAADPLLVSVRSGARVSMPGMMDTVLNLGLNDATVRGPCRRLRRRALRLGQLSPLHPDVRQCRARPRSRPVRGSAGDRQGGQGRRPRHRARRRRLAAARRPLSRRWSRRSSAVLSRPIRTSSSGARSGPSSAPGTRTGRRTYRRLHAIPGDWGTAVNVQAMVFGNMGETAPPASPSPAIPRPAKRLIMANI